MFDPKLVLLTDATQSSALLLDTVTEAIHAGVRAVVVREKHMPSVERNQLIEAVVAAAAPFSCSVIAASSSAVQTDGIHLAANDPMPFDRPSIVGRSCHSVAAVAAAVNEGCDYVTLSPIFTTASKPGYGPPLGTSYIATVAKLAAIPVVALGGIDHTNAADCIKAGAAGVAVMGGVMRARNVTQTVASLISAVS